MSHHLRIARPVTDLDKSESLYCVGLGLQVLGGFQAHDGFDGVMLGSPDLPYHFEFTVCRTHPVQPTPTAEDLLVVYVPDPEEWKRRVERMRAAGFTEVASLNPYWDRAGRTFADHDGYRVVIQNGSWVSSG